MTVRKVAMLTAGGLAPCLSAAVGGLIERYTEIAPDVELIAYLGATTACCAAVRSRSHRKSALLRASLRTSVAARSAIVESS